MLLELMSGGDLKAKLLRVRTLSTECAAFYAACTAAALQHLHQLKIVYRDLKPENLVISRGGALKLIDFGLSKVLGDAGRTWTLCGTPQFMAPEIIKGHGYGLAADWWALGILVYEMVAGECPFDGETQVDIFRRIMATARRGLPADDRRRRRLVCAAALGRRTVEAVGRRPRERRGRADPRLHICVRH